MNPDRWCNFAELRAEVIGQFRLNSRMHGPLHWQRVEQNGILLSEQTGADQLVVRIFAWIHDSQRETDFRDPDHGPRAAKYAAALRGRFFQLEDSAYAKLMAACEGHTREKSSEDITIGTCWDADRLDLVRLKMVPLPRFMSTAAGKRMAEEISQKAEESGEGHHSE